MKQNLMALLICCVTFVLLELISVGISGNFFWLVVIATIVILTVLILAVVEETDKLSNILTVILEEIRRFFLST